MPPQGKLPAETIAGIREWVAAGAPTPCGSPRRGRRIACRTGRAPGCDSRSHHRRGRKYWAFRPLSNPAPPDVKRARTGP